MRHPTRVSCAALSFEPPPFLAALPADPVRTVVPRQVHGAAYSFVAPTPVAAPQLLAWSADLSAQLGLPDLSALLAAGDATLTQEWAEVFAGNRPAPGMQPYATCYGGHQFGQWAGQLGDGRAIILGALRDQQGGLQEIQLKGAGLTPYSRHADGRAVLRSSLREYLCSEAMYHLGVPTTRALCLVGTGEGVVRDMFYDGRPGTEPGAIVTRVAPSFLRFGHFELCAARGDLDLLRQLLDHTLRTHFAALGAPGRDTYLAWFDTVCRSTAELMAQWLRVGFVHGVMNTDNLSILGLTIDYGPYGWLDVFDPAFTPNTTDTGGRYSFANQARIAAWNLTRLAQAILPLVGDAAPLEAILEAYRGYFETAYLAVLRDKLGLAPEGDEAQDFELINTLFACFSTVETDMTIFYRRLTDVAAAPQDVAATWEYLSPAFYAQPDAPATAAWLDWLARWQAATQGADPTRVTRMQGANPWLIPRNWLCQQAIDAAAQGDLSVLTRLHAALRDPYTERAEYADLAARMPAWARTAPGCGALSCSS